MATGSQYANGERPLYFAEVHELFATNTSFRQQRKYLAIWNSSNNQYSNHIDYIPISCG